MKNGLRPSASSYMLRVMIYISTCKPIFGIMSHMHNQVETTNLNAYI